MKTIYMMRWMALIIFVFVPHYMGWVSRTGKRALELLEQFNLTKAGKRPFKAYSKGMKESLPLPLG